MCSMCTLASLNLLVRCSLDRSVVMSAIPWVRSLMSHLMSAAMSSSFSRLSKCMSSSVGAALMRCGASTANPSTLLSLCTGLNSYGVPA